jgi:hypothetical protein
MTDTEQQDQPRKSAASKRAESQEESKPEADQTVERDLLDSGVPMIETDWRDEPTGPEDALGEGPTRGDYSERIGPSNYHPHQVVAGEQREDGSFEPVVQRQRDFVEQGETPPGTKGGVNSAQEERAK